MEERRPNILHIFCDQLRYDAICANGNGVMKTPNLDRLSRMGVTFDSAFTPSPVCVAARCSMITGKYPTETRCVSNDSMPVDMPSFMSILKDSGYRTHGIGKCHFTPDADALRGFETRERQEELSPEDLTLEPYYRKLVDEGYGHCYEAHGVRGPMYYVPQPSRLPQELHPTNWIGDRAVHFIEEDQPRPWYLFASFIHPHPPFAPPVPWHKIYDPVDMPMPKHAADDESMNMFVNRVQNRYKYRDYGADMNLVRCMKAYYYACISFIDYQVGRILDALERTGQLDSTMIVFTSDHGELMGDYGSFGKRSMQDGPARIPMIIYEKGVFEGGRREDGPVSLVDLAPTFLETAGVENGDGYAFDGKSIISGRHDRVYSFFSCYQEAMNGSVEKMPEEYAGNIELMKEAFSNSMVTDGKWKYIYSAPDHKEFLFCLAEGRRERENLHGKPEYAAIEDDLRKDLMNYLESHDVKLISENGKWKDLPEVRVPEDRDGGLITQDITCGWYDENLPGYREV